MLTILELYQQSPYWLWLGVGGVFFLLNLITGVGRLVWASLAAAAVAGMGLVGAQVELPIEIVIFGFLTLVFLLLPRKIHTPRSAYVEGHDEAPSAPRREPGTVERSGRLVGRIGKTTGAFVNGVGRVWIEGAEWGADLEAGEVLGCDTPVRIIRVDGGLRLQVRALYA